MHSTFTRLQNVFSFFTTVACVFGAFIATTDLFSARSPSGIIAPANVQIVKGRPHYYSAKKQEYAIIKFSLEANLSTLFTWNTKQVFVYVTADWPSEPGQNATNSAVIWDSIITNPSADHLLNIGPVAMRKLRKSAESRSIDPSRGILKIRNQKPKYQISHPEGKVAQVEDVTLKLHYNVQPWVGVLTWDMNTDFMSWKAFSGLSEKFSLPALKSKDAKPKSS